MNPKTLFFAFLCSFLFVVKGHAQDEIKAGRAINLTINGVPVEDKTRFDGVYPVSESGMINLPYIGLMRAAGLKSDQLARSIQGEYQRRQIYTNPTVQVLKSSADTLVEEVVHVGGQVGRPGPVKYMQGLTLYQAVQAAGGATPFGQMKRVKLYSGGKMRQFDLTQGQFMAIPLKPGDTIEVPQKGVLPGT
ncbi:MAG: SLBB domain-containing protein [Verrucomicrobia bacterium]|nr:SLBB domain-containing protein [Verrucomicrobiota bacterium]